MGASWFGGRAAGGKSRGSTARRGACRRLTSNDMVVADTERAQGIAGIIGGANSAVQSGTTDIFLEAATWEPRSIRRTARLLGLRTEASSRFEKGLSPELSR